MAQTYYQLLGVSESATSAEIEAAFRSRASEVHPDRVSADKAYLKSVAAEAFKNLSEAKSVLLDPDKRRRYDEQLARSRDSPTGNWNARAASPAPDSAPFTPPATTARPMHVPSARFRFAIVAVAVFAVLVVAGLLWNKLGPLPPATIPSAATPTSDSPPAHPIAAGSEPPMAQKKLGTPAKATSAAAGPNALSPDRPHTLTLWRATQSPDLSSLSASDRLNIESACSYAKLESPDEYNGCLVQQLAVRGTVPPPPDISTLPASQREAIQSACSSTKLMQGPAAHNQCVVQQLELAKRRAH